VICVEAPSWERHERGRDCNVVMFPPTDSFRQKCYSRFKQGVRMGRSGVSKDGSRLVELGSGRGSAFRVWAFLAKIAGCLFGAWEEVTCHGLITGIPVFP
jgi:hypothetical protein